MLKRLLDIVIASIALVILSPLYIFVALPARSNSLVRIILFLKYLIKGGSLFVIILLIT